MTSQSPDGLIGIDQSIKKSGVLKYTPVTDGELHELKMRITALEMVVFALEKKLSSKCPLYKKKKKAQEQTFECEDCSGLLF